MNAKLGGGNFGGVDNVRPILEFRRLLSRVIINNPYPVQDDMTPEEKIAREKGKIIDMTGSI